MTEKVNWDYWKKQFEEGHTIASYIFIIQIFISAFYLLFYGNQFEFRLIFLISFASGLGALVDTTAHLYLSKVTVGLSASNFNSFWKDLITLRAHVLIGELIAFTILTYEIIIVFPILYYNVEFLILYFLYLIGIGIIIKTKYYH